MAFYDRPRDPRFDPMNPHHRAPAMWFGSVVPYAIAAILVLMLIAMFYPTGTNHAPSDTTSAGPSTQMTTPAPSPETTTPGNAPTTGPSESRPTQAPIR